MESGKPGSASSKDGSGVNIGDTLANFAVKGIFSLEKRAKSQYKRGCRGKLGSV